MSVRYSSYVCITLSEKKINTVSVVGAGNVGWHLARALYQCGVRIINVYSRTREHAANLAAEVAAVPVTRLEDFNIEPDMYLISIPDDALLEVTASFAGKKAILAHTSGSISIEIFNMGIRNFGVFYPLQTFTLGNEMEYSGIPFLIEGSSPEVTSLLRQLADKLSGVVHETDSETRLKVHIAAVFACNFSNHLAVIADHLLSETGLGFDLIRPLISETYRKMIVMGPLPAQTGPALRNDIITINNHLKELKRFPFEQQLYKLLSDNISRYGKTGK